MTLQYSRRFLMSLDGWWKYGITFRVKLREQLLAPNTWFELKSLGLLKKARGIRTWKSCELKSFSAGDAGDAITKNGVLKCSSSSSFDGEIPVIISVNRRGRVRKPFASSIPALTSFSLEKLSTQPRVYPKCMVLNCRSLVKPFPVENFPFIWTSPVSHGWMSSSLIIW